MVYLARCADHSLYCGITKDLAKRMDAHNLGKGAAYTRSRTPVRLWANSLPMNQSDALKLEHRIKKTPADRKLNQLLHGGASPYMKNQPILHEIQIELHSLVRIIQQLTACTGKIVAAIEKLSLSDSEPATTKRAPVRKKVIVQDGVVKKIKRIPATRMVYDLIQQSQHGADAGALGKATGFNQQKIHNILFRLNKQGRIKRVGRGVYKGS